MTTICRYVDIDQHLKVASVSVQAPSSDLHKVLQDSCIPMQENVLSCQ